MSNSKKLVVLTISLILWIFAVIIIQFTFPGILIVALIFELIPGNDLISIILLGFVSLSFLIVPYLIHRMIIPGLIVFLLIALLPINGSLWFYRDRLRNERMVKIQLTLEELRSRNKLPKTLSDEPKLNNLSVGFFGIDRI